TFELIDFLFSNFKVSVAVAFLQRKDNLISFDGNAISYSVNANLFGKAGDLQVSARFRQQAIGWPVKDHWMVGGLENCPMRGTEEMGIVQFGFRLDVRKKFFTVR
ncbi:unnamed protein product, partial [Bubo scandiacus]